MHCVTASSNVRCVSLARTHTNTHTLPANLLTRSSCLSLTLSRSTLLFVSSYVYMYICVYIYTYTYTHSIYNTRQYIYTYIADCYNVRLRTHCSSESRNPPVAARCAIPGATCIRRIMRYLCALANPRFSLSRSACPVPRAR